MSNPDAAEKNTDASPDAEPDVVLPGEDDIEVRKNNEFTRSAMTVKSIASGIPREKWGSKTQFLMSCIASAVGLGNVWRFPAICAKNGGAAFLIPYVIVLFVIARPLLIMELSLGQFTSKGSVRCWDLSPILTGIGIAGSVSSVLLSTFYIMLLAWALIYIALSLGSLDGEVMWLINKMPGTTGPFFGGKILHGVSFNSDDNVKIDSWLPIWHLVLALVIAWFIIWLATAFGVEASGKLAYVTALGPYVVLIILLIVGCSLPGADVGILYFVVPEWKRILDPETWFQAVGQCFFSLGIGFGGCIMFASFNDFNNDLVQDVLILGVVDTLTSILAGFSLLSILGYQASLQFNEMLTDSNPSRYNELQNTCERGTSNLDLRTCVLENLVGEEGGAGMAFVHYPAAMYEINKSAPGAGGVLGFFFFFMLLLLAVGSANGFVGTTVTIIADRMPTWNRKYIVTGVCFFSCLVGMIYTNGIGSEWFDVVDQHGVTAVVYVLSCMEAITVIYVYGLKNFCNDIQFMRGGKRVGWYLRITWVLLPVLMEIIFTAWLVNYQAKKTWTPVIKALAWALTVSVLLIIPGTAIYKFFEFRKHPWRQNVPNTFCGTMKAIIRPSPRWGPKDAEIRRAWKVFKAETDPSYHIWSRVVGGAYRLVGKNPPAIPVASRASNATSTATVPRGAGSVATPESVKSADGVQSETPSTAAAAK